MLCTQQCHGIVQGFVGLTGLVKCDGKGNVATSIRVRLYASVISGFKRIDSVALQ